MLYLQPNMLVCHFCEEGPAEIVFPNGQGLCCKCFTTLSPHIGFDNIGLANRKPTTRELITLGTFEEMHRAIVVMLDRDSMPVTNIAKKLGITRATVYALLRRAGICKSKT